MSEPEAPRPQLLRLDFRPGSNLSWVGSALAVVAGALASHRLGPDASSLLTLILALLLADPLLGGLWNVLVFTDWTGPWRESTSRETLPPLPHTVTGSPAHRLAVWLAQLQSHDSEQNPRGLRHPLSQAGFYLVSVSALAGVLGAPVLLLAAAAFLLALVRATLGGEAQRHGWLETGYSFTIPWLIGYGAFGALPADDQPASLTALVLGVAVTLAYHGFRGLVTGGSVPAALWALDLGQILSVLVLVVVLHPWQAGVTGLLLVAQALWQPLLWRERDAMAYARATQGVLALSMLACFV
jgi:hypothetical protein